MAPAQIPALETEDNYVVGRPCESVKDQALQAALDHHPCVRPSIHPNPLLLSLTGPPFLTHLSQGEHHPALITSQTGAPITHSWIDFWRCVSRIAKDDSDDANERHHH
jgi:hypothetical protein